MLMHPKAGACIQKQPRGLTLHCNVAAYTALVSHLRQSHTLPLLCNGLCVFETAKLFCVLFQALTGPIDIASS